MMGLARGALLPVIVAASVLGLPACDEGQPAAPTNQPTPTPAPVRGVLVPTFAFDQYFPDIYVGIPLPLSQGGILDVTVDWTFPDSWIYVYIARGTCTFEQLSGRTCPYLVVSETQFPKPRVLVTEPLAAGTYSLILYNVPRDRRNRRLGIGSDNIEAISFQIGLTVGGAATPQAVAPIAVKPFVVRP